MIIKKSALYGIIILSTAALPLSAQAATGNANEIYASPDTFSFQTTDGNIVCRARTINSGDLFDIDLLGRAPSVVCLIHRTESGKGHDCQPDAHAYASLQNSIPNRGCLSGIPAEFYRPNPKYRILQEKEKVETPYFTCRLNDGGIDCNSTESPTGFRLSPTEQDYH